MLILRLNYLFSFENRKISSQKPLILKSFTLWNPGMMLSLSPIKATYVEKNNYLAVQKPGTLLFELVPIKKGQGGEDQIEWDKKKSYSLGVKQIGTLLQGKYKPLTDESSFSIQSTYTTAANVRRLLQIKKEQTQVNITVHQEDNLVKDATPYTVNMSIPEYVTILELSTFALPFLLGWQALYTPQFIENDLDE